MGIWKGNCNNVPDDAKPNVAPLDVAKPDGEGGLEEVGTEGDVAKLDVAKLDVAKLDGEAGALKEDAVANED